MNQSPLKRYQHYLETGEYKSDAVQRLAINELQRVYDDFMQRYQQPWYNVNKIVRKIKQHKEPVKGLYMWGGVGIGKTWLMDIFCESLPKNVFLRTHFHRFMRQIHLELKRLQGEKDPLKIIAERYAAKIKILCFDEFFVSDITDAMFLAGLLQAMFDNGITLVTTSNCNPDELYKNGLQRERFLPAIELIKKYTQVLHMPTKEDYRLRSLHEAGIYYCPLGNLAREKMRQRFEELADMHWTRHELLIIEGRGIQTIRLASSVAWFNFSDLCSIPRSQIDYLIIARSFHTVLLSNVPQIQANEDNLVTYLINLVDIFYDASVKLIVSAEVPIDEIYLEGRLKFEFQRTKSRLQEMQSLEYLQKPHGKVEEK